MKKVYNLGARVQLLPLSSSSLSRTPYSPHNNGASCSKLTTSLVNVSLKFQTLILQIHCYFLLKNVRILCSAKDSHIFSTKNNSVFVTLADICLINYVLTISLS